MLHHMVSREDENAAVNGRSEAQRPGPVPPLRMDALLSELQEHVERVRGGRDRMQTLLDAVLAVGSNLDLEDLLRRIVQSAVDLVDAEYGALGVLGEEGTIRQFITVGMDQGTIGRIGHYPEGHGILGLLSASRTPCAWRCSVSTRTRWAFRRGTRPCARSSAPPYRCGTRSSAISI
ncbi:hypothetical protein GCM10010365_46130 [Streptomyces poonensis]|uniref:Histidine kinase n=1 Tax=Streptomyces poonensis TaxID=68255 RepID=A0A918PSM7_9ACTN|nr:hypothetical protein GCM10010365_46130 [Streptomyces poonensis]